MTIYNMNDAKNNLSKTCNMLTDGDEDFVIITDDGIPVVKVVPYISKRIGILENKFKYSDIFDDYNEDIKNELNID